jgi:HK97 family phage major capsid protein
MAPVDFKDTIKRGRGRLAEINTKLGEITSGGFKSEDGKFVVSTAASTEFKSLMTEAKEIRVTLDGLSEAGELNRYLNEPATESVTTRGGGGGGGRDLELKTLGQRFIESEEFKGRQGVTMPQAFEIDADVTAMEGGLERKDLFTTSVAPTTNLGFGTTQREPMVIRPFRMNRVRDLFDAIPTTSNLIEYIRSRGYLVGADPVTNTNNKAAMIPEKTGSGSSLNFGLKPKSDLTFETDQAPVRTIAHWIAAHRNVLDDEPQLRSLIDGELLYGLRLVEDAQLLFGDGTGDNVKGIFSQPYIQKYPGTGTSPVQPGDTRVDAVRRAATRVVLAEFEPTGVVVHPLDWEGMELTKDALGNYVMSLSIAQGGEKRVWKMPVVASPAMTQGRALVGAFGLGARVYDRQIANVRTAEQHADFFVRNALAILAECRLALTVPRPESFVDVDLTHSTAPIPPLVTVPAATP